MKKSLLFMLTLLMMSAAFGQVTVRVGKHDAPANWTPSTRSSFSSSSEAKYYAQEIIDVVGLKPNFEVVAANVDNAAAVVYGGKRYVLYNPNFINALVQKTGNKWAAISVLAHEIGHHLNGHTVSAYGSQPAIELEADEFSGFVLRKMGASLTDAQAAMKVLASQTASRTHPAQYDRLTSIARGWQSAHDRELGKTTARVPDMRPQEPIVARQGRSNNSAAGNPNTTARTISREDIIGNVRFNADPYAKYYITSQYNLVRVANNQLYTIGKLARLNSRSYPYVIHDSNNTQLLVNINGAIVTTRGQQVGVLTAHKA